MGFLRSHWQQIRGPWWVNLASGVVTVVALVLAVVRSGCAGWYVALALAVVVVAQLVGAYRAWKVREVPEDPETRRLALALEIRAWSAGATTYTRDRVLKRLEEHPDESRPDSLFDVVADEEFHRKITRKFLKKYREPLYSLLDRARVEGVDVSKAEKLIRGDDLTSVRQIGELNKQLVAINRDLGWGR